MRKQRISLDFTVRRIQRGGELMALRARELEVFVRHDNPPWWRSSPLPQGEVGAKRRVRGLARSTNLSLSPEFLALLEMSNLSGGGSRSSVMSGPVMRGDASPIHAWCRASSHR